MKREIAERLAELLATPDGLRTFRLLQSAGLLSLPLTPTLSPCAGRGRYAFSLAPLGRGRAERG